MDVAYHYPPELLSLLVDAIPALCRSKADVLTFLRGAGVPRGDFADLEARVREDRDSIRKHEIVRTVLGRINERGDSAIGVRRELLKRVVEYDDFSTCWANEQLKAKGLVSEIRRVVGVKDSFTRMKQERERERQKRAQEHDDAAERVRGRELLLGELSRDLSALFGLDDTPQLRGTKLESILNRLFAAFGILVRESFRRVGPDDTGVVEQIDGVIEFDAHTYIVEMKWQKEPVGTPEMSQHLVRLFGRADVRGLFIASSGYTGPAVAVCREALAQRVIVLATLQEVVLLLERRGDLQAMLHAKTQAAVLDKNPYVPAGDQPRA